MIRNLLTVSITLALTAVSTVAHAEGDPNKGKVESASCGDCHGGDGNSAVPSFPKLAGQHASYISKQLLALKAGERNAPMMAPLAAGLSDQAIENIAAYYSEQKTSSNDLPTLPIDDDDDDEDEDSPEFKAQQAEKMAELLEKGGDLYRNGDLQSGVSACIACHGPYGEGNKPAAFPAVRSQHADYLIKTLKDYKQGARQNSSENMMRMIAAKMTEEQIQAASYYMSMMK